MGIGGIKMKVAYPTIFTETDNNILIEIPDLGILTESNSENETMGNLADAVAMARDAIGLHCISMEDKEETLIRASRIQEIDEKKSTFYEDGKTFVSIVDVDLLGYRQKNDMKMVRRNVTLPNWLNREAEAAHINVSRVLQEALMSKLNISKDRHCCRSFLFESHNKKGGRRDRLLSCYVIIKSVKFRVVLLD
jgi:hypothetical protein